MFRRTRRQSDFDSEIEAHIQLEADRLTEQGMDACDALLAARRSFGNRTHASEQFYEAARWMPWDHFRRDLRFAARVLAKDARFSALAILGLALGIGVSTAIFALINLQVRAESQGREDSSYVGFNSSRQGSPREFSYPEYLALRETRSFRDVVAESGWQTYILQPIAPGGDSEDVQGRFVSANYLSAGGLHCAVGRTFTAEEERTGIPVAVLDYSFWMQRFAGNPDVLGKSVTLNGHPLVVVGVSDPRLMLSQFYLPLSLQPSLLQQGDWLHDRDRDWLNVEGWLRPGVSVRQSQAEMDVLARSLYTDDSRVLITAGGPNPRKRRELMAIVVAITAAVSMILLIACSNLANLLLARAVVRRREIGVRLSLGASRLRLISQLLTESLLLSCAGGVVGLLLAYWFAKGALLLVNASPALLLAYHADPRVALYGVLLSVATGLSFGLAPALAATRTDLAQALHAESMNGTARDRRPWSARNLLVVVPLAVSLMLLLGAGVALRNVQKAYLAGPSFDASRLIGVSVRLNMQGYDEARTRQFQEDLHVRMASTPGVASLAMATAMPLANQVGWLPFTVDGTSSSRFAAPHTDYNIVSPEFFQTVGVAMARGRAFTAADREGSEPVALVNQELARKYWPAGDAIGRRIRLSSGSTFFTIVGIAPDMADASQQFSTVRPIVYVPYAQGKLFLGGLRGGTPAYQMQFLVRVNGERSGVKTALLQEVTSIDPALRISIRTMQELLEEEVGPMRTISLLLSGLGALALLMAAVGIYAILAYSVSQRTREIGIRAALGAQRYEVVVLIMRRTATLIAWGIAGGLFLAFVLTKVFARDMAKFGELDVPICVSVSFALAAVALLASFLPARKALRVDPATALRTE